MRKLLTLVLAIAAIYSSATLALSQSLSQAKPADIGFRFVEGVNADSAATRVSIVKEIYATSTQNEVGETRLIALFEKLRVNYGTLAYHHSERTGEYLHLYAQSVDDKQWHDFQFKLNSEPSPKLLNIVFIAEVAEPIYLPNGSIDNQYTLNWLDSYVEKLRIDNDLAAAVLIAKGDSVIFERYFGYADASRMRPIGPYTRMNLGSGNKMLTALAIMQLRDAGKLRLTDTLVSYFPKYPHQEYIRTATVHHLLSHTSGSGDYWTDAYEAAWDSISSLDQMMPFVLADTPTFAPGTQFQYSNSGFILAGKIVEIVSGRDYFDYIRENIYQPLAMANSDSYLKMAADTTLSEPLRREKDGWVSARHGLRGSSAGGGYSTPRDILKFMRGLQQGSILSLASLEEMTVSRNLDLEPVYPYGYGFGLALRRGRVISYGHAGQAPGINLEARYYPDDDITMVIFCNQDNGAYDDLRKNIDKLITGDR